MGPAIITVYLFGAPLMVMAILNGIHSIVTGILLALARISGETDFPCIYGERVGLIGRNGCGLPSVPM